MDGCRFISAASEANLTCEENPGRRQQRNRVPQKKARPLSHRRLGDPSKLFLDSELRKPFLENQTIPKPLPCGSDSVVEKCPFHTLYSAGTLRKSPGGVKRRIVRKIRSCVPKKVKGLPPLYHPRETDARCSTLLPGFPCASMKVSG